MSDIKNKIVKKLNLIGLSDDEALVYLELLEAPNTHLELARRTGINRTRVYRIADELEKRSLVTNEQLDTGRFLVAADPKNLEIALVNAEQDLKAKRQAYKKLLGNLQTIQTDTGLHFVVKTYEGVAGFKQMLWNELKTQGELLVLANGALEDLVNSRSWSEKHRAEQVHAGYKVREIINPGAKKLDFTKNKTFLKMVYSQRLIEPKVLDMKHQITVYNDTVGTYCWRDGQKVGLEIINKAQANTQRQIFEHYWKIAKPTK